MDNFDLKKYLTEGRLFEQQIKDIESILVKAGFNFEDGVLGGVGSGGAGYYDDVNDEVFGFNDDQFNEEVFSKWYDSFSKDSFNSFRYDQEDLKDTEINTDMISQAVKPGIYAVGEVGYAEIHSNGDIEMFAAPMLGDEDGNRPDEIFSMNSSGEPVPEISKEEVKTKLQQGYAFL